jgi:hypothetical protein
MVLAFTPWAGPGNSEGGPVDPDEKDTVAGDFQEGTADEDSDPTLDVT